MRKEHKWDRMKLQDWKIPYTRPEYPAELRQAGCGPLLSAVLALRGIRTVTDARALLDGGLACLHDPLLMAGMPEAVERIRRAFANRESVAVYGDYDVDGITATCLVTDYLQSKGLHCVGYIPDRNEEGYGLNCAALDSLRREGVTLLITVDCGITAVEEAAYTRKIGLDMIVTDHHECKEGALPDALAVIDCKQEGNRYPNPDLAGVGVAMKLVCACEQDDEAVLRRYADLVAVGTVADVMPLVGENRYLVRRGLEMLAANPRPGFAAMLREAGVDPARITASSIGFSLAPRLNAAGRLGQATKAADLLMATRPEEAAALAAELCELNRQRQSIETEIWKDALSKLEGKKPDGPIVLASDRWHQGVIGIAASRLAEQFSLPAIMVCLSGDHGKGSCRSYGGFNLFEALSACSRHLLGFGGHALAAGMTIRSDKLPEFRRALTEYYKANKPEAVPEVDCDLLIRDAGLLTLDRRGAAGGGPGGRRAPSAPPGRPGGRPDGRHLLLPQRPGPGRGSGRPGGSGLHAPDKRIPEPLHGAAGGFRSAQAQPAGALPPDFGTGRERGLCRRPLLPPAGGLRAHLAGGRRGDRRAGHGRGDPGPVPGGHGAGALLPVPHHPAGDGAAAEPRRRDLRRPQRRHRGQGRSEQHQGHAPPAERGPGPAAISIFIQSFLFWGNGS